MFKVDAMNNVFMTRGDDVSLTVSITNDDGSSYTMAAQDTLTLTARDGYESQAIAFTITATGTNTIPISSLLTSGVTPKKYVYDIELHKASSNTKHTIIGPDGFNNPTWSLLEDVTR